MKRLFREMMNLKTIVFNIDTDFDTDYYFF